MAAAQAEKDAFQFTGRELCYIAARFHLAQAELGFGGSSFWKVEAGQTLVIVAHFEFKHFTSPCAVVTTSWPFALMSVLCRQDISRAEKEQITDEEEPNLLGIVMLKLSRNVGP